MKNGSANGRGRKTPAKHSIHVQAWLVIVMYDEGSAEPEILSQKNTKYHMITLARRNQENEVNMTSSSFYTTCSNA